MTPVEEDFVNHIGEIAQNGVTGLIWSVWDWPQLAYFATDLTTTTQVGGWSKPSGSDAGLVAEYSRPRVTVTGTSSEYGPAATARPPREFTLEMIEALDGSRIEIHINGMPQPKMWLHSGNHYAGYRIDTGFGTAILYVRK